MTDLLSKDELWFAMTEENYKPEVPVAPPEPVYPKDFSGYTTRHLLNMRDQYRGYYDWWYEGGEYQYRQSEADRMALYAELNSREHVPNKSEAKEIRRKKSKTKRNNQTRMRR